MNYKKILIAFKVFILTGLFLVFLFYFGIPAVEKYMREKTIVIRSEEDTGGIEAPAVTFSFTFFRKVGWRTIFENATVNYVNFKIALCSKSNGRYDIKAE